MWAFFLGLLVFLLFLWAIFEPNFDHIELYCGEDWLIMWYNRYYFRGCKLTKERDWTPLFAVNTND